MRVHERRIVCVPHILPTTFVKAPHRLRLTGSSIHRPRAALLHSLFLDPSPPLGRRPVCTAASLYFIFKLRSRGDAGGRGFRSDRAKFRGIFRRFQRPTEFIALYPSEGGSCGGTKGSSSRRTRVASIGSVERIAGTGIVKRALRYFLTSPHDSGIKIESAAPPAASSSDSASRRERGSPHLVPKPPCKRDEDLRVDIMGRVA